METNTAKQDLRCVICNRTSEEHLKQDNSGCPEFIVPVPLVGERSVERKIAYLQIQVNQIGRILHSVANDLVELRSHFSQFKQAAANAIQEHEDREYQREAQPAPLTNPDVSIEDINLDYTKEVEVCECGHDYGKHFVNGPICLYAIPTQQPINELTCHCKGWKPKEK